MPRTCQQIDDDVTLKTAQIQAKIIQIEAHPDPGHPVAYNYSTVDARLAALGMESPPDQTLIGYYSELKSQMLTCCGYYTERATHTPFPCSPPKTCPYL